MESVFFFLEQLDDTLWAYLGFPVILFLGLLFSWKSRFIQVTKFPYVLGYFFRLIRAPQDACGVHPLKTFFACVGGCVGLGNIVGICTGVQFGGPGALLWVWLTAILGTMVKYAEVYLGVKYRVPDGRGGYKGGPMYFLQRVFRSRTVPLIVALLLALYGIEVFQFGVITTSVSQNWGVDRLFVTFFLISLVLYACLGGVKRVGTINAILIPVFVSIFLCMGLYVLWVNLYLIPDMLQTVFISAFTGHAAVGGFIGSTTMIAISQGIRRGCYSGDLGIGYASVIHSETSVQSPAKQAALTIFDLFLDTFVICTTSILIILVTGVWQEPIDSAMMIQAALEQHFPYMSLFMPIFIFLLGFSTITSYFISGVRCAQFVSLKYGKKMFIFTAIVLLVLFSFVDTYEALVVMSLTSVFLLLFNGYGLFKLRHEIDYEFVETKALSSVTD